MTDQEKWLRRMHLKAVRIRTMPDRGVYIAMSSALFYQHGPALEPDRLLLLNIYGSLRDTVIYEERDELIIALSDAEMASEILHDTDVARVRQKAERMSGVYVE